MRADYNNELRACYAILGINWASTQAEIKEAYRKLALKHHPDLNPRNREAAERFKQISAAYRTLCDSYPQPYDRPAAAKAVECDRNDTYSSFMDALMGRR